MARFLALRSPRDIVYKFADGVREITLADYLRDNTGKTETDFAELKALSDEIYYDQDQADGAQARRNSSIHGIKETERCATRPLEDELKERYLEIHNCRYAWQDVRVLLEGTTLTEVQLHIFIQSPCASRARRALENFCPRFWWSHRCPSRWRW